MNEVQKKEKIKTCKSRIHFFQGRRKTIIRNPSDYSNVEKVKDGNKVELRKFKEKKKKLN